MPAQPSAIDSPAAAVRAPHCAGRVTGLSGSGGGGGGGGDVVVITNHRSPSGYSVVRGDVVMSAPLTAQDQWEGRARSHTNAARSSTL